MDFRRIEKKWQEEWEKARVFEPKVEERPKFFLTVPFPYTSGPLHIGHGRTNLIADIIARYKRLSKYNVLWPMGFHITGTPILAISDRIKNGDEEAIKLYESYVSLYINDKEEVKKIVNSFKDPRNVAEFFADHDSQDFKSLGFSIDWRRKFNTGEKFYNRFVEWQFKKLHDLGLLTKGKHPVLFSPVDDNAVGEDDIKDGDVNKVEILEYTIIKFKFEDGYIIASTLRPETIFGITNIWVNKNGKYVKAKVNDEFWYLSEDGFNKLKYQKKNVELIKEIGGEYFLNKKVKIFDNEYPILPADFVDTDNATGFVYSVPAHAPYDYIALKDLGLDIKPIKIINIKGIEGIPAKNIIEKMGIKNQKDPKLKEATKELYKDEYYNGILNERCGKFSGLQIREIKNQVKDWLKENGLGDIFYETSRKAVTRAGNKVIVSIIENQWFIDYSKKWLKEKGKTAVDKLIVIPKKYKQVLYETINWLHERPCARKRGIGTRLPYDKEWVIESLSDSTIYMAFYTISYKLREVDPEKLNEKLFDYVFLSKGNLEDVSKSTKLDKKFIEDLKKEFEYWYPNDERHTAPMHLTNHLTFFILNHVAIFPEKYWPKEISLNEVVIREGTKMSKSKGNVIPLLHIIKNYGVDLFRLYMASAAGIESVLDWNEKDVESVRKKLNKFVKVIEEALISDEIELDKYDEWLVNYFYKTAHRVRPFMNTLKFKDASTELFFEMLNKIRIHEKINGKKKNRSTIKKFLFDWLITLSPFIPHITEEFWHKKYKSFIYLQSWPDKEFKENIPADLLVNEGMKTLEDIRKIIKIMDKLPNEIRIIVSEKGKTNDEFDLFERLKKEIINEFKCKVIIEKESESKEEKASKSKPYRPAIVIK